MNIGYSKYQFVVSNLDNNEVLAVLPSRDKKQVEKFLADNFSNIEIYSQDLWRPYKSAVLKTFSDAKVVADRFHVVRQFIWAFSRERIKIQKETGKKTGKNWRLLTKAKDKLDEKGIRKLESILEKNPTLKIAYTIKEKAIKSLRKNNANYIEDIENLGKYIKKYEKMFPEFKKAYKTLINWKAEIYNMFIHDCSNGSQERINRSIKQYKNIAFGFANLQRASKLIYYRLNSYDFTYPTSIL